MAFVVAAIINAPSFAQEKPREPKPDDNLQSVEVAPDRSVTLRLYAPKADEVSVGGEFGGGKMTKNDVGIWSLTTKPLDADFYTYSFNVDGVKTVDPRNPIVKPGISSVDSMFEVPGDAAAFEANADVPHGDIHQVWYRSSTFDCQRRLHVYTPPGYGRGADAGGFQYPVFYLLHGSGDDDAGWSTIGRAGFILDNLIAAGTARPMLVVMLNGSLPFDTTIPQFDEAGQPSKAYRDARNTAQSKFPEELLNDVVPLIEKTYRVSGGPANRALAGLSMGGGQTLRVLTLHPDQFAYIGIWSAGLFRQDPAEWEEQNADFLSQAETVNSSVKLLSMSCGKSDFLIDGAKALGTVFEKHHINHEFHLSEGGHTWINWRHYLNDFAPKLFQ